MYRQDGTTSCTPKIIYHISIENWDGVASANCLYESCDSGSLSSVGFDAVINSDHRLVGATVQFSP